ncbi:MAG: HEAT repeat domain-containing protein [Acidobacteria bacterium]|nr:HEAT repeat domain-containing protein [Acidobacteriota bacterium]MBI3657813.1 HEAT repeat domain-containing protein [Acidobacteriota bacterium]
MKVKLIFFTTILGLMGPLVLAGNSGYTSLRDVDFENFRYQYGGQSMVVQDGHFEGAEEELGRESLDVILVKFGFLTQSANEDAIVLTRYNGGGTGLFDSLYLFKLADNQPVLVSTLECGDRAMGGVRSFYVENGSLYVTRYDDQLNPCNACFDFERTVEFKLKDQTLAVVWKSEPQPTSDDEKQSWMGEENEELDDCEAGEELPEVPTLQALNETHSTDSIFANNLLLPVNPAINSYNTDTLTYYETLALSFDQIIEYLGSSSPEARSRAVLMLANQGGQRSADYLHKHLSGETDGGVRSDALWALGELRDLRSVDLIIRVYEKTVAENQPVAGDEAIEALGKIRSKEALPLLVATLDNVNPDRRAAAAWAIGEIGDTTAVPALQKALASETQPYVRPAFVSALQKLGTQ